jgi:hypothetical protein
MPLAVPPQQHEWPLSARDDSLGSANRGKGYTFSGIPRSDLAFAASGPGRPGDLTGAVPVEEVARRNAAAARSISRAKRGNFFPRTFWAAVPCDDRRMDPQNDPEDRIRELERPLADQASTSELGAGQSGGYAAPRLPPTGTYGAPFPPPPPPTYGSPFPPPPPPTYGPPFSGTPAKSGMRAGWILLAVFVVGAVVIAAGVAVFGAHLFSSRGWSIASPSARPSISRPNSSPTNTPTTGAQTSTAAPGAQISVSGIGENKTIACNNNAVNISGVSNTIVITGHCASLNVSGIKNTITVDAADSIEASGFNNQVTYHSGTPSVNNFGESNVVQQG